MLLEVDVLVGHPPQRAVDLAQAQAQVGGAGQASLDHGS